MVQIKVHITEKKKNEVEDIKRLIKNYKVMGVVNLEKLPAFNLMKIKTQLKDKIKLKYSKKRLIKIAFDQSGDKNIENLKDKLIGIPALIFTNEDPFKLFQLLKKSKSPAPAKDGDTAPRDIMIPAGPTEFTPGPMIGELGQLGIKTSVEGGKVVIKNDKLLVKEGEKISAKHAELMSKLKIEPMEIGLNLVLTYGNNEILVRSVLDIDTDSYFDNIKLAAVESINLAVYSGYITEETIELLIKKAVLEAESLSNKAQMPSTETEENIDEMVNNENVDVITSEHLENNPASQEIEDNTVSSYEIQSVSNEDNSFGKSTEEGEVIAEERLMETESEKKTALEKEIEEKYVNEIKNDNDLIIEQRKPNEVTKEDIKRAEQQLKDLINKKIRGEI